MPNNYERQALGQLPGPYVFSTPNSDIAGYLSKRWDSLSGLKKYREIQINNETPRGVWITPKMLDVFVRGEAGAGDYFKTSKVNAGYRFAIVAGSNYNFIPKQDRTGVVLRYGAPTRYGKYVFVVKTEWEKASDKRKYNVFYVFDASTGRCLYKKVGNANTGKALVSNGFPYTGRMPRLLPNEPM